MLSRRTTIRLAGAAAISSTARPVRADSAKVDVLVLGAGFAGLYAALTLEQAGMKVKLLEGSPRIGGRAFTAYDLPGHPELGCAQVGAMYARVRAMAARFNVKLAPPLPNTAAEMHQLPMAISLNGRPVITQPWVDSPENPMKGEERKLLPNLVYESYVTKNMPLKSVYDWYDPKFAKYDTMSLHQYMKAQGASDAAIKLADYDVYADTTAGWSALDAMRKNYYYGWEGAHGMFETFVDGASAMTNAMATGLSQPVLLNKFVHTIDQDKDGVTVECEDGSTYSASFLLCTIPFSVLRGIKIKNTPMPAAQRRAIGTMDYAKIVSVWVDPKKPYWQEDGLPEFLWSNGPQERMFSVPSRVRAEGNLSFYLRGEHAMKLSAMSTPAAFSYLMENLASIRPSAKDALNLLRLHSWPNYKYNRGGYAYFRPGQINDFGQTMAKPAGRIHFAGEHTAKLSTGMEGGCESGERAAIEILGV
jgi:monoamine oxidase